jgi:hypothetical protein
VNQGRFKELFILRIRDAESALQIGEEVYNAKMGRDQGVFWKDFVKENFPFSVATANRYIRVYEAFKDRPEALRGETVADALRLMKGARRE